VLAYGSAAVGTAEGRPGKGWLMLPASSFWSVFSPDEADASRTDEECLSPGPWTRSDRRVVARRFELRCADVHPFGCQAALRAETLIDMVALACEHGALVHGLTPAWYSPERLQVIEEAGTQRPS
jgi:hypothetical protein